MALVISPELIQEVYANNYSDEYVQGIITELEEKIGACLSAYGDYTGGLILANYIASILYNPAMSVKSEKGSFGDSVTYNENMGKEDYLAAARSQDTNNCLLRLQSSSLGLMTMGQCS